MLRVQRDKEPGFGQWGATTTPELDWGKCDLDTIAQLIEPFEFQDHVQVHLRPHAEAAARGQFRAPPYGLWLTTIGGLMCMGDGLMRNSTLILLASAVVLVTAVNIRGASQARME